MPHPTPLADPSCVVPSAPALVRGVGSAAALSLGQPDALRAVLTQAGALDTAVEVAVAAKGDAFYGDEQRRQVLGAHFSLPLSA